MSLSAEDVIQFLKCVRCGTREDLIYRKYEKAYKYKTGGPVVYTVHKGADIIKIPVCRECNKKIKRWQWFRYSTLGLLILSFALIYPLFYYVIPFLGAMSFVISFFIYPTIVLTLLHLMLFFLAYIDNPRLYVKISGRSPYVRSFTSTKWIPYKTWLENALNRDMDQPHGTIHSIKWILPLIGGIVCLFLSMIYPPMVIVLILYSFALSTETFVALPVIVYILISIGAFFSIKNSFLLKRANSSIKSLNIRLLIYGSVIAVAELLYFLTFAPVYAELLYILFISPVYIYFGFWGILIGAVLIIIGGLIYRSGGLKAKKIQIKSIGIKTVEKKRFCTNCGVSVDETHQFCPNCGENLES